MEVRLPAVLAEKAVAAWQRKVKLLKRQMYGRASFPLLRQRILLT